MTRPDQPTAKKRIYKTYNEERMKRAVQDVNQGKYSVKKASELYGINRTTLMNHVKGYKCKKIGHPTVLSFEEEKLLVHSLTKLADWGFGFDRAQLRICVRDFVNRMDRPNPFKDSMPGIDWCRSFEKRWKKELSRRVSQNLPKNRAESCSKAVITHFYEKLTKMINEHDLKDKPQNIFNCDETGFQTDPGSQKVLCKRGCRNPHKIVSNVTKATYTVLVSCNAIGDYLPLFVNYKGLHLYSDWCQNGPQGTRYNCSPSGWMESDQFLNWFEKLFIPATAGLQGAKLLIYDGHNSHISLKLVELAEKNNILLLCLPAHTSHILQPLDVAVYKGVKSAWRTVLKEFFNETKFHNVDKPNFPRVLKKLVESGCLSRANAISGFEAAGIFPINKEKVLDKMQTTAVFEEPIEDDVTPSTSGTRSQSTQTAAITPQISPRKALEESLLSVLKTTHKPQQSIGRKRLTRTFAESLTSPEAKKRLECVEKQKRKQNVEGAEIKKKKLKRKLIEDYVSSSDEVDDPTNCRPLEDNANILKKPDSVTEKDWVLVQFSVENSSKKIHYIGKITDVSNDQIECDFLRKRKKCFIRPNVPDVSSVPVTDIVCKLNQPKIRRGLHEFNLHFIKDLVIY